MHFQHPLAPSSDVLRQKVLCNKASSRVGGGLSGYVKSKPLGIGQIISIDVMGFVMIIAVFH